MKKDTNCLWLVRELRRHGGREFAKAADTYDRLKVGRVSFIARSPWGPINRESGTRGLTERPGQDSNVWLQGEAKSADFLVTAVHESGHLRGLLEGQEIVQLTYDAYMELTPQERAEANYQAQWFYDMTKGQVGRDTSKEKKP